VEEVLAWYAALPIPLKIVLWVGLILVGLSIVKRLVKLAILVTILIILIFVLRAVVMNLT
jgi:hypothetical protein